MFLVSLILAFILGFIAWFISTLSAGGAVSLLMPILAFTISAELIPPTVTTAALLANPTRVFSFWRCIHWPIASRLIIGSIIGAAVGASLYLHLPSQWLLICIGLFLISTPLQYRFGKSQTSFPMPQILFIPLGFIVALISGMIGGSGAIYNPFLLNSGLQKEALIATKAINSFIMQLVKLISYSTIGALTLDSFVLGVTVGVGGALSIFYAKNHLAKIEHKQFHQYALILMFISGCLLIVKAL